MRLLDGKSAIITGAGNGIGRATALLFAREGAKVIVNDVGGSRAGEGGASTPADDVVAEIRAAGGTAVANYDSVATPEGARAILDSAVREFGRVDVLVNNAGILRDKTLLKLELAQWDAVIEVHLKGTFLCTQAAALVMKEQGSGRIVNTTSVSGLLGNFGQSNYAAAKAGIYGLTRTASIELQRYGISVNAVAPVAKTRMTEDLPMFAKIEGTLSAEHVAPAHLFLASDLCGERTGIVLAVAGARMSIYKVVESAGQFKESDGGIWTAEEIEQHFDAIAKL
jgi:NAD(P)-dependent dehydrogenase (short-subunit alcohol dehydrogenase family)